MASQGVVDKGLKQDALGFVSSVVIGVASTAPGPSLAAVLTLVVAAVGLQAPAVLIVISTAHKLLHLSERPVLVVRA